MSPVICHVLPVPCHLSCVTCHLSITLTATATDPPPANFPSLCTVGWFAKTEMFVLGSSLFTLKPKTFLNPKCFPNL